MHCTEQLQTEDSHVGKNELQWLLRSLIYEAKELSLLSAPQRPGGATSAALTTKPSLDHTAWLAFVNKQTVSQNSRCYSGYFAKVSPRKEKTMTRANVLCKIKFKKKISRNSQLVVA